MSGLRLRSERIERLPAIGRILAALASFCLFAGIAGCTVAATGIELAPEAAVAATVCAALVVAAGAIVAGKGRIELMAYAVVAAVLLVACVALSSSFVGGGAQLVNAALVRIGERTQVYGLPYKVGGESDLMVFCALAAMALALACSALLQRGFALPCLILAAAALICVAMGWIPVGWWAVALAAAIVCCLCVRTALQGQGVTSLSIPFMLAGVLVAGLVACGGAAAIWQGDAGGDGKPSAVVSNVLWRLQYGDAHFAMPEGQLDGLGPLAESDQEAIEVKTDSPTREYLRGFVGESYGDGAWTALSSDEIIANRSLLYWLDADGFQSASQLADAAGLCEFGDAVPASLTEEFLAVRKPYAYLPYGYGQGSSALGVTDMSQMRLSGTTRQSIQYDAELVRNAYLLQDVMDKKQVKAETYTNDARSTEQAAEATAQEGSSAAQPIDPLQALRTYLDDNQAYRQFAEEIYLEVPEDVAEVFRKLYGPYAKMTCEQAKIQVQALLDDTVAYSAEVETDNGEKDFVEYFLTESCEGYSVHYATAATLLMRYYGVPARYVEGYVLDTAALDKRAEEAKEAEAAETGAGESAGSGESGGEGEAADAEGSDEEAGSYTLTEHEAHAWVEYYLDGVGWIPFDVTPGWRDTGFYHTTKNSQLVDESQNWSVGEARDDAVWTPPEDVEEESEEEEEPQPSPIFTELDFPPLSWPWIIEGFLLTLFVAFCVRDAVLYGRLKRFLSQADDPNVPARQSVPALFSYLVLLLRVCGGVDLRNVPFAEQDQLIRETHLCSAAYFARAAKANDRALFAGDDADVGQDDVRAVMDCISSVLRNLEWNTSPFERFWQRHVRCLW